MEERITGEINGIEREKLDLAEEREKLPLRLNAELQKELRSRQKISSLKTLGGDLLTGIVSDVALGRSINASQITSGVGGMIGTIFLLCGHLETENERRRMCYAASSLR